MGKKKFVLVIILCLSLLSVIAMFSVSLGVKRIAFSKIMEVIFGNDLDSIRELYLEYWRGELLAYREH